MKTILIADSGSTKTDWILYHPDKKTRAYISLGLNPFVLDDVAILKVLQDEVSIPQEEHIDEIYFYGAGIKNKDIAKRLENLLSIHFKADKICVESDMLAAARATCHNDKGVCGILGTGSNSCYYNGKKIIAQNPSLGYIIGDEGSGVYLGKRVLQYYFYNTFDDELREAFKQKYAPDLTTILARVYGGNMPNRYLATFTEFLVDQRGHFMVENIIEDALIDYHQRHILKYRESWKYPIHLIGAIAFEFQDIIRNLHENYGLTTGTILKGPINGLLNYHSEQ